MTDGELKQAAEILRDRFVVEPKVHFILGSGLGAIADQLVNGVSVPFSDLPGWPASGVVGHEGRFVGGLFGGAPVMVQSGRYHLYEGYEESVVVAPVRLGRLLGAHTLVVTNAAGGIRRDLVPGTVMMIEDHLNLMFRHALAGSPREGEQRFPDMSQPYDRGLQDIALNLALSLRIPLLGGTYAAVLGPNYETPAEIRSLAVAGADAVGMSTVPEVTVARAGGQRVLGFSLITNAAAGLGNEPLSHHEVSQIGAETGSVLGGLLEGLGPLLFQSSGA